MMKKIYTRMNRLIISFLAFCSIGVNAYGFVEPLTPFNSVESAVTKISTTLENQGYKIVLVVDHAAGAESVGLVLRPTQVIFARPNVRLERKLLRRSNTLAIDLPVKVLIFEDEFGDIQIRTNPIGYLIDRHNAHIRDYVWSKLERTTEQAPDIDQGLITIKSQLSLDDAVAAVQQVITSIPAFKIPLTLELNSYRKKAQATLIVFGNPNAGTPLMQATQEIAIDLPQKILVWEDAHQQVNITYNDPKFLAKRHNVQGQDQRLEAISQALANFAQQGAGN
jgi:uncharacterized protein (DUF302 family)